MALSPLALSLSYQQPITTPPHANVAPTDVLGAYQLSTNAANQQYLAKLQQQNAMWGGLAGLGGAGLTAYMLRGGLSGAPGTPAAAPAPASTAGAPMGLLPNASAPVASNALDTLAYGGGDAAAGGVPLAGLSPSAFDAASAAAPGAASVFDTGAAATPFIDAGTAAGGSVAADLGATAGADALAAGGADASAMTLADLLPFLFAA